MLMNKDLLLSPQVFQSGTRVPIWATLCEHVYFLQLNSLFPAELQSCMF
jgi:hypothetical protein